MKLSAARTLISRPWSTTRRGSVLIIVLWISLGLVTLAIYFANSMSMELRAADNQCAGGEADFAIDGAARYVNNILANFQSSGTTSTGPLPDPNSYQFKAVAVGSATFWVIGRGDDQSPDRGAGSGGPDSAGQEVTSRRGGAPPAYTRKPARPVTVD